VKTTLKAIQFVIGRAVSASPYLFLIFVLTVIFLSFTDILNIFVFKEILDSVNNKETTLRFGLFSLIFLRLGLEVVSKVISRYSEYIWLSLDTKQLFNNYSAFLSKLSSFDLANFEDAQTHDLIWRAFNRFQWHIRYYLDTFFKLCSRFMELAASIVIFFVASPMGAIFIVIANIIPIYIRSLLGEQNFNIFKADSQTVRKYEYLQQMAVNRETLMELKQFQGFGFLKDRLFSLYSSFTGKQMRQYKRQWIWLTLVDMLPVLALTWFLVNIVTMLQAGNITVGTFVFLFTNIFIFSGALSKLSMHMGSLTQDAHFMFDAINFFNVKQSVVFIKINPKQEDELFRALQNPTITIESMSFKYPNADKEVLKNINLTIPYGQNVALIGENGAGKTTLVKLLLRIYDPTEGRILINGVDLREIPESLLFKMYSTLFQSFGKFYLTIRENLELAAGRKLTDEEYTRALKLSNAWNYVKDFSKQLDQQLGPTYKDGVDLSGGQWQQLAIARALIRKAPVLILDEPTSAIDAKAETEIFDRLNNHTKENTLIFISHRFSTIKDAERIVVLDKGRLIEDGTHAQLMKNGEKYAKLYSMQAERYSRI
jgi:ABC-type multidrug transport system fused ATPase/permease subunit